MKFSFSNYLLVSLIYIQQNNAFSDTQFGEYLGSTSKHLFYFVQVINIALSILYYQLYYFKIGDRHSY